MTQEQKQLLLIDLCGRLPYGVRVNVIRSNVIEVVTYISPLSEEIWVNDAGAYIDVEEVRPYLRPMSSMTEEEKKEWYKVIVKSQDCSFENNESASVMVSDWLLSKGFDVRGLIPMGLALKATEGMYKTE